MKLLELVIKTMNASLNSAVEMADGLEISSEAERLIGEFKEKYKISPDEELGNAKAWETSDRKMRDDYKEMEHEMLLYVWTGIMSIMLECGAGDIVEEVVAKELINDRLEIKP